MFQYKTRFALALAFMEGVAPYQVIFIGVLAAYSHGGLVDQGFEWFKSMTEVYNIECLAEHYICFVDLLGQAGRLKKVFKTLREMKIAAPTGIRGALLGASSIHHSLEPSEYAAENLLELERHKASNYVLLSNMHAETGRWNVVERVRVLMKEGTE